MRARNIQQRVIFFGTLEHQMTFTQWTNNKLIWNAMGWDGHLWAQPPTPQFIRRSHVCDNHPIDLCPRGQALLKVRVTFYLTLSPSKGNGFGTPVCDPINNNRHMSCVVL